MYSWYNAISYQDNLFREVYSCCLIKTLWHSTSENACIKNLYLKHLQCHCYYQTGAYLHELNELH